MPSVITYPGVFDGVYSPIVFSRASSGTYFNSAGVLTTAETNVPRIDYTPGTLVKRGLLIEEARTNSLRNNMMVGAVAGTPGTLPTNWSPTTSTANGITRTIVGTGTENGITYIDIQYSGTAVTGGDINISADQNNFIAASQNQVWTFSTYLKLVGGSFANMTANTLYVNSYTSASAFDANATSIVTNYAAFSATGSALNTQRYFFSGTLSSATAAFVNGGIYFTYNAGAVINFTLRVGMPQLEQGAFATSVIPTTTAAVTRSADLASLNTLSPWFNSAAGTVYSEFVIGSNAPTTGFPSPASFTDNTANNRIVSAYLTNSTDTLDYFVSNAGVSQTGLSTGAYSAGTVAKMASAYAANDFAVCRNGGTVGTDTSGTVPTVIIFHLGNQISGNFLNGYLRRITYYPTRLTNAQLQAITA